MQKFKNSSHVGEIFDQFMSFEGEKIGQLLMRHFGSSLWINKSKQIALAPIKAWPNQKCRKILN